MSFSIDFVAVTANKNFMFHENDLNKGEALELGFLKSTVLGQIGAAKQHAPASPTGVKVFPSPTHSGTMAALNALSFVSKIHVLELGLFGLQINAPGTLNIYVRHEHVLWPTTGENFSTYITSSTTTRALIISIFKFLDDNDMGQWGPLLRICECIDDFARKKPGSNYIVGVTLTD
jgi:hypothetical protein